MEKVDFQVTNKVAAFIGRQKLKIDRGRGWAALIQFAMQGVTMLAVIGYGDWIRSHVLLSSMIGMAMVVGGLLFIGEVENRLGLVQAEYGRISSLSPVYQDIFAKFEDLNRQNAEIISRLPPVIPPGISSSPPAQDKKIPVVEGFTNRHAASETPVQNGDHP